MQETWRLVLSVVKSNQGHSQKFAKGGTGVWGTYESPQRGPGAEPRWKSPPKAGDMY